MSSFENSLAIIGMAGRFPGANDVRELWRNVAGGIRSIRALADDELVTRGVPESVWRQANYVKAAACVEDIERFDAAFFGYTPRDAEIMDPQHRLFLECAWHALEDAGRSSEERQRKIGVFAGSGPPSYRSENLYSNPAVIASLSPLQQSVGNDMDALSSTVSYKLDLKGPSVAVQTFCSTSLVAVHMGCQSLLTYESDLVLAGGVAIGVPQGVGYVYEEGGILSPDGHCRSFDRKAAGSVMGNGVGVVVLKRAEEAMGDGDHIYALIRGSAVNNDGRVRVGYTAPGLEGQAEVMAEALANAGVEPESIGYVEAHGTATALGDAVELAAMKRVFGGQTGGERRCALGTIKPNVGHLDRASGVTGLIKAALMLERRQLPPQVDYEEAGAETDLAGSGFYVNRELRVWEAVSGVRRAGVSSFGLGGTNAHVVLEEAPVKGATGQAEGEAELLVVSAKSQRAVEEAQKRLGRYLAEGAPGASLGEVAYTLQVGRCGFNHRRIVVSGSKEEAAGQLELGEVLGKEQAQRGVKVGWWFPGERDWEEGQGAELEGQWAVYGAERRALWEELRGEAGAWEQAEGTVKRLIWGYGLARVLKRLGVEWEWTGGQGEGAWVAACVRGEVSVLEAVRAVRGGQEAEERARPAGWMGLELVVGPGREGLSLIGREGKGAGAAKRHLLKTLGRLWLEGVGFAWTELHGPGSRRRVSLPPYAFEPTRFWVEPGRGKWIFQSSKSPEQASNQKKPKVADWFYVPVWKQAPVSRVPKRSEDLKDLGAWFLFGGGLFAEKIGEELRRRGCDVIRAEPGPAFCSKGSDFWAMNFGGAEDFVRLFAASARPPSSILYLAGLDQEMDPLQAFHGLLSLASALETQTSLQSIRLSVLTRNASRVTGAENLSPGSAMLLSGVRAIPQEQLNVTCRSVDIGDCPDTNAIEVTVHNLLAELEPLSDALGVAWRNRQRWIQEIEPLPLDRPATSRIRRGGVYLITGGLGKIGLILAEHLARSHGANLVLVSRSALPPAEEWDQVGNGNGTASPPDDRIVLLKSLRDSGIQVMVCSANVADEVAMGQVIRTTLSRFGRLDGVIHAAGISDSAAFQTIRDTTMEICDWHLEPKLKGLRCLHKVLTGVRLDFCLVFSSLSSQLGGLGLTAYAAANLAMDTLVQRYHQIDGGNWLSVNWDTWRTQVSEHRLLGATVACFEMIPSEAIECFETALGHAGFTPQIVVSTGDLQHRLDQWVRLRGGTAPDGMKAAGSKLHPRPNLPTSYAPPQSKAEKTVAEVLAQLLGLEMVGVNDNFFELGGHSLIGTQLVSRLRSLFNVNLPLTILFQAPTVGELVIAIESYILAELEARPQSPAAQIEVIS